MQMYYYAMWNEWVILWKYKVCVSECVMSWLVTQMLFVLFQEIITASKLLESWSLFTDMINKERYKEYGVCVWCMLEPACTKTSGLWYLWFITCARHWRQSHIGSQHARYQPPEMLYPETTMKGSTHWDVLPSLMCETLHDGVWCLTGVWVWCCTSTSKRSEVIHNPQMAPSGARNCRCRNCSTPPFRTRRWPWLLSSERSATLNTAQRLVLFVYMLCCSESLHLKKKHYRPTHVY